MSENDGTKGLAVENMTKLSKENVENVKKAIKRAEELRKIISSGPEAIRRNLEKLIQFLYEDCLANLVETDKKLIEADKKLVEADRKLAEADKRIVRLEQLIGEQAEEASSKGSVSEAPKDLGGENDLKKHVEGMSTTLSSTLSSIVEARLRALEQSLLETQAKSASDINKNIVDASHKLYTDVCGENYKNLRKLNSQMRFFRNVSLIMSVIILVLVFLGI